MRVGKQIAFGFILVLVIAGLARAQMWIRSVDVPCTVTDAAGRFVTDLQASDFIVRDNGKKQKITGIRSRLQSPLSIALLVDRSRSVSSSFSVLQTAAEGFLKTVIRKSVDRACLVGFDSHVYLLQDWTDDVSRPVEMLRKLSP